MQEAAEPKGKVVIRIFVINGGKVGEGGVDAGEAVFPCTHTCI